MHKEKGSRTRANVILTARYRFSLHCTSRELQSPLRHGRALAWTTITFCVALLIRDWCIMHSLWFGEIYVGLCCIGLHRFPQISWPWRPLGCHLRLHKPNSHYADFVVRKSRSCHEEVADLSPRREEVGNKSCRVVSCRCNVNWPVFSGFSGFYGKQRQHRALQSFQWIQHFVI